VRTEKTEPAPPTPGITKVDVIVWCVAGGAVVLAFVMVIVCGLSRGRRLGYDPVYDARGRVADHAVVGDDQFGTSKETTTEESWFLFMLKLMFVQQSRSWAM
jgi:hypothetical protein